ncbi:MAG: SAM-dependent methyltransferase [Bacteroidales bacterium]|nr:SAM-dependent methyltransferase [Bacteroidales bacterium]
MALSKKYGKIYLLPCEMGEQDSSRLFPAFNAEIAASVTYFIVEQIRSARRSLKKINPAIVIDNVHFAELNKHAETIDIDTLLQPVLSGHNMAIMSEAGMPCIADPGAVVVNRAHELGVHVVPLVGPSSILMALVASGGNGQNFAFHGYVPMKDERKQFLQRIEQRAKREGQSQIFMETPYRNAQLFSEILQLLQPSTKLCVACNISCEDEYIATKTIAEWRKTIIDIAKKPTMFVVI